ncbi:hypothetical protein NA57DRAFT_54575 [Rhizodiscina lignyota]|uniref:USP domain-containing protein n=1 Tax=Rhizodiscina lignyota TaxID=1504668 RepID=A0A9P4IEV5_9PEZI|nr:hypothetical protein NA57DRAFT_54575 [Rhizodiscina lignyota]
MEPNDDRDGTAPPPTTVHSSRAPSSEPSLPRRDLEEDADTSVTRKRPRLDSGDRATRSMSADRILSMSTKPEPQHSADANSVEHHQNSTNAEDTPSKLTITVRPHLTSPSNETITDTSLSAGNNHNGLPTPPDAMNIDTMTPSTPTKEPHDMRDENARNDSLIDEMKSSPPVVEVDGSLDDGVSAPIVTMDNEEYLSPAALLGSFPFRQPHETYIQAAKNVTEMMQSGTLKTEVLRGLSDWIEEHLRVTAHSEDLWADLYCEDSPFWEEIGTGFSKLSNRSKVQFLDSTVQQGFAAVEKLVRSYVQLCARLLRVDTFLLQQLKEDEEKFRLLCARYLRAMAQIAQCPCGGDDGGIRDLLTKAYTRTQTRVTMQLLDVFFSESVNGMRSLVPFAAHCFEWSHRHAGLCQPLLYAIKITTGFARCVEENTMHYGQLTIDPQLQAPFITTAVQMFRAINVHLQDCAGKVSFLPNEVRRSLFDTTSSLLIELSRLSEEQATLLFQALVGDPNSCPKSLRPELIGHVWKIKTLKKHIAKGKMEIRVMGVDIMQHLLVSVWQERDRNGNDPVLQYLVTVLLEEKIINYMVGVDSHPTLISRCGNIIGLLAVTHRYGPAETDIIWNTVANSPDPRVVAATLQMFSSILNLIHMPDVLHICKKMEELPIAAFNVDIVQFFRRLLGRVRGTDGNTSIQEWHDSPDRMNAYHLCMRMTKETFPGKSQVPQSKHIHAEAVTELLGLAQSGMLADRALIYADLLKEIQARSPETGANMEVLFHMLRNCFEQDLDTAMQLDLFRITIEELRSYVQVRSQESSTTSDQSFWLAELGSRLDLVVLLLHRRPGSAPEDLLRPLWDVMVGDEAINNSARDAAWYKLADIARPQNVHQPFLDRSLTQYLPELNPQYYTPQLYSFIEKGVRYQLVLQGGARLNGEGLVDVPSADLMWRAMLSAPVGTIEDAVSKLLAAAYNDTALGKLPKTAIEATHIFVANKCVSEMVKAASEAQPQTMDSSDAMETEEPSNVVSSVVRFRRTVFFLGTLLQSVRSNTAFITAPKPTIDTDTLPDINRGDPIIIKYQSFNGHVGPWESVEVGDLETRRDLYVRLSRRTGFQNFFIISSGQRLNLLDNASQTLQEWGKAKTPILVKKDTNAADFTDNNLSVGRCAMEMEILKSFDKLYALMDRDDELARLTYDFLAKFPPHQSTQLGPLCSGTATVDDAFPAGKLFKTRYSIRCLQARLESQLRSSSVDLPFVQGSLRLLSAAFSCGRVSRESSNDHLDITVISEMVHCYLKFLREIPTKAEDIPDGEILADQLLAVLENSMASSLEILMCETYYTILLASLHWPSVWNRLQTKDLEELHKQLLLVDFQPGPIPNLGNAERPTVRANISHFIKELISTDLPWACVTANEIAAFFWKLFVPMLPETINYEAHSVDFFHIADNVFVKLYEESDESKLRDDTDELRVLFETWSALLLEHKPEEFAGRDERVPIVYGFAQLLRHCAYFLRQSAKPIQADQFIEDLFDRFLFPPLALSEADPDATAAELMPLLDTLTRKRVNQLILALCQSQESLKKMIARANDSLFDYDPQQGLYWRNRTLRSSTGLVGIKNLGNTCYMNSLLTQLFMNVAFRKFILSVPVQEDSQTQPLVWNMQVLFTKMQNGYGKYVDATKLTQSIRTFEGEAIDITQQMDVEEFENLLIDQLEGQILDPVSKQVFRDFYGGQMINQIKSKECEHVSERLEPYFAVQCDVKGKSNLWESLQAFVEGDVMEGDNKYKCESCGGRFVSAVKRVCLKDVPDNLIFHLKRFDFDIGTMQRSKINDLFEFPMRINVHPYTIEHLNNPANATEDNFDLVGVLLHKGVAEHGHYFSYIRSRPGVNNEPPKWIQFDDADVTEFNPSEIKEKCFGGWMDPKEVPLIDGQILQKGYNAYMLFYQRANTIERTDTLIQQPLPGPPGPPKVAVPEALEKSVAGENESMLREYATFDPEHMVFIENLLGKLPSLQGQQSCSNSHEFEKASIKLAMRYLHQVYSRTKDVQATQRMFRLIRNIIGDCLTCNMYALTLIAPEQGEELEDTNLFLDLTIRTTLVIVRHEFAELILDILMLLREHADLEKYGVPNCDDEFDPDHPFFGVAPAIIRISKVCVETIPKLALNLRAWDDFFNLVLRIAGLGIGEVSALLSHGVFQMCLEILCCSWTHQREEPEWKRLYKLLEKRRAPHNKLVELVHMLLSSIDLQQEVAFDSEDRLETLNAETYKFSLTQKEEALLTAWDSRNDEYPLIMRMFDAWDYLPNEPCYPSEILAILMNANLGNPRQFQTTIRNGLEGYGGTNLQPFYDGAAVFCRQSHHRQLIIDILDFCVEQTFHLDANNLGVPILRFFNTITKAEATSSWKGIYTHLMRKVGSWAPNLLMDTDHAVRNSTFDFAFEVLVDYTIPTLEEPSQFDKERVKAVHSFIIEGSNKLRRSFNTQQLGKQSLSSIVTMLVDAAQFLQDLNKSEKPGTIALRDKIDDDLIAKVHELRQEYESWPFEDSEVAQSAVRYPQTKSGRRTGFSQMMSTSTIENFF